MEKREHSSLRRLIALLLFLAMLAPQILVPGLLPEVSAAQSTTQTESDVETIVIAGSDFQPEDDSVDTGKSQMSAILTQMKKDYGTADGFLFCGDYNVTSYTAAASTAGKEAAQEAIQSAYSDMSTDSMVWVQGNHDPDSMVGSTLSASGAHDADAYGVYVINEKDYMWYNNEEATIKNTAAALDTYLDAKVEASYSKPIFVVSHLPLHYSMRTKNNGDGQYANYIFNVINSAGAKGLNIIFLFGHDHSNGWDDYLGGSAVYLAKGDSINIAQASKTEFEVETLNFTYMNAGYVGYYKNVNADSEQDLTMTVFKITGSDVTIARYSADGIHNLKSVGVPNVAKSESGYAPDTRVYTSPQTVALNTVLYDKTSGVAVSGKGFDALEVAKGTSTVPTGYTAYQTYDIHVDGHAYGNTANVSIPVDSTVFDVSKPVLVIDHEDNKVIVCQVEEGYVHFTTTHMGPYTLAQADVEAATATGILPTLQRVTADELKEGVAYVISDFQWNDAVLTTTVGEYSSSNGSKYKGFVLEGTPSPNSTKWYIRDGYIVHGSADSENYLWIYQDTTTFSGYNGYVTLGAFDADKCAKPVYVSDDDFNVTSTNNYLLNRRGGQSHNNVATVYKLANYHGSMWHFDEVVEEQEITFTVTPSVNVVTVGNTVVMFSDVLAGDASMSDPAITWTSSDDAIATVDENGVVTPVSAGQVIITATLTAVGGVSVAEEISVEIPVTVVSVAKDDSGVTASTTFDKMLYLSTSDTPKAGVPYVIVSALDQKVLTGSTAVSSYGGEITGLEVVDQTLAQMLADDFAHIWYYNGTNLIFQNDETKIMLYDATGNKVEAGVPADTQAFDNIYVNTSGSNVGSYSIQNEATAKYLNRFWGNRNVVAHVYSATGSADAGSAWWFYQIVPEQMVSLTVTPNKDILHPADILHADETVTLVPTVTVDGAAVSGESVIWTSSDTSMATVDANGKVTPVTSDGGHVVITATMTELDGVTLSAPLSVDVLIQLVAVKSDDTGISAMVYMDGKRLKTVTTLEQNVAYVISDVNDTKVVTGNTVDDTSQSSGKHFLQLVDKANAGFDYGWYYDGTYLRYGSAAGTDNYMVYDGNNSVTLGANNGTNAFDRVVLTEGGKTFTVINTASNMYLNHYYGNTYYYAGGYPNASQWHFLKVISGEKVEMKIAPHDTTQSVDTIQKLDASVWLDNVKKSGNYEIKWTSSNARIADVSHGIVTPVDTGDVVITASLVSVDGATLDEPIHVEIPITITKISSVAVSGKTGTTYVGASNSSSINQYLTVIYADGSSSRVPVKLSMLSDVDGAAVSTAEVGVLTDLTLTYAGIQVCEDFALKILERNTDDFPDYPNEGAVFIDKQGHGVDFRSSGLAQVELTATGIPSKKGADVIIMLDTSSSMTSELGGDVSRLEVLTASLNNLVNQMQSGGVGDATDIRVAVADFNGYFLGSDSPYYIDSNDTTINNTVRNNPAWNHKVYTGTKQLNADAFVDVHELGVDPFYTPGYTGTSMEKFNLTTASGTNYDYAFDAVYQLGEAIQTENAEKNLDRDLFVIFMSDGAPFQFNYFSSQSNTIGATHWNNWLLGTFEDSMFGANANKTYYHPQGLHWMAEAIKGDPAADYDVIRKNDSRDTDGDNRITLKGLGATMYSIGFCLEDDKQIKEETMDVVIQNIASAPEYYYKADTASELENAFNLISNEIFYAATGAYVIDTMGPEYDLQLKDHSYTDASSVSHTVNPVIQFKSYSIYTNQDFMDGRCTEDQIGARKTDADGNYIYTLMEEVTFSPDGTAAYSNVLGNQNILADGLISASTFWYNTTGAAITLPNGYSLAAETFYWKLGTISTMELALSYYVYLTGSMEGTRGAGSYNTNTKAELFYTNYLGNDVSQEYPIPHLPWAKSTVGYGFYLVNEHGKPIVNQSTGQVGTFKRAVKLGEVVYQDFYWNESNDEITGVDVIGSSIQGGIPTGYELFDPQAAYKVGLSSNGLGYYTIYSGNIHTTYVEGVSTTPVTGGSAAGETVNTTNYATTSTMVWFAVVVSEDPLTVDKTVEKDGDNFLLTLEAFASGETTKLSNVEPADIVLVLDQSSSMYTPLGWSADRFKVSDVPTVRGTASGTEGSGVVTDFEKKYAISGFAATAAEEVVKEANNPTYTSELLTNAQRLGYYVAVHNKFDYVYLVQYAQDSNGVWGWYYVSVDETTRSIDDLDYDTLNTNSDYSSTGKGYITTVYINNGSRDLLTNVTYYKSQYGALVESVESFIEGLRDSSVDHRVGIVGFASPFYDGWDHYDGTGLYVDGKFYLYDTDFMYRGDHIGNGVYQFDGDAGYDETKWTGIKILDPNTSFTDSDNLGYALDEELIKKVYTSGIVGKTENGALTGETMYDDALVSVQAGYSSIMASVDAITANYQQTCPAVGLEIAENIFAARSDGTSDRDKIVILFSDGVPTVKIDSNRHHGFSGELATKAEYWSIAGGVEDSLARAEEAKANGVRLYTIGTAAMGSTTLVSNTNITSGQFVQYLSSNYTGIEATGVYTASANKYTVTVSTANATVSENQNYAQFAAVGDEAGSDLTIAFDTVMSSITTPSVKLNAEDILRDVLSEYFDLIGQDAAQMAANIEVYTQAMKADGTFAELVALTSAKVTLAESVPGSNRFDIINVTGYDYGSEYILNDRSQEERTDASGNLYYGSKLVVKIPIQVRDGFWGGNGVPTNKDTSAVYDVTVLADGQSYEDVVTAFPVPNVNVPKAPSITVKDQTIYYAEDGITATDILTAITIDGKAVTVTYDAATGAYTFTPAESWMDDYAALKWTDGSATTQTPISGTQSDSYTFGVVLIPDSTDVSEVGTVVPSTGKTATATGNVKVLIPVLTFRDSMILSGKHTDKEYYDETNYLGADNVKWVDSENPFDATGKSTDISSQVTMGTEPTLTLTYTPEGSFTEDTAVDVTVMMGDEVINGIAYFEWMTCSNSLHNEAVIPTHKADENQVDFWIHVSSIKDDSNGLITDKYATPLDNTNTRFMLTLEAYATGTVTSVKVTKPADIVLVLDHSASMRTPAGATNIQYSKNTAKGIPGALYGEQGKTDKGQLTKAELSADKGQRMGYYVAQSTSTLTWFIMEYDAATAKWIGYSVPSTESIVNKNKNLKDPTDTTYTEHTQVLHWSYSDIPGQLVFYKTQYAMLYESVLSFVQELRDSDVAHSVSIVGFADSEEAGTRLYVGGDETAYKPYRSALYHPNTTAERRKELYQKAMKNVAVDSEYEELLSLVEALDTNYSYTCPAAGLQLANEVLEANPAKAEERDRIVVLFTDGIPNKKIGQANGESVNQTVIHNEIIAKAAVAKQTHGAKVYSISTATMNADAAGRLFLRYASSDYPNATSMSQPGTQANATLLYTKEVNAFGDLELVFGSITNQFTSSNVSLKDTAVLVEVLTEYFEFIKKQNASGEDYVEVLVYTQAYKGKNSGDWYDKELINTLNVQISSTPDSNINKVAVSGFDYAAEYVSDVSRPVYDENGNLLIENYYGKKLVVEVMVKTRDGFWGGDNVATNDVTTGLYSLDSDIPIEVFPVPEVQVPIDVQFEMKTEDKVIYFGGLNSFDGINGDILDLTDLLKVTAGGVDVEITPEGFKPAEDWMDDFVSLNWTTKTETDSEGNEITVPDSTTFDDTISNTTPGDYPFSVTLTNKHTGATSTKTGTASVSILVPVYTFHDTTVPMGYAPNPSRENYTSGPIWVDMVTGKAGEATDPDTKPTLTETYVDVPANINADTSIHVTIAGVNPDGSAVKNIMSAVIFRWENCGDTRNHDDAETVVTHYGTDSSIEFTIHTGTLVEDVVVIDFGLSVEIDLLANDTLLASSSTLLGVHTDNTAYGPTATGTFGGLEKVSGTTVRYTLTKAMGMQMFTHETFTYAVSYDVAGQTGTYYGTVKIIPATVIYYEDNFVTFSHDSTDEVVTGWTSTDATVTDALTKLQDTDRPGSVNPYGYDSQYVNMTQYSMGAAMKVNVYDYKDGADVRHMKTATAEFTFWGTGFDVVSLTSNKSGTIMVTVDRLDDTTTETRYLMVDTYYSYIYDEETQQWRVSTSQEENAIYQIPVMKVEDLDYGKYAVEIFVAYNDLFDHGQYTDCSYDFYLDAIRIYNPADSGADNSVIEGIYYQDHEAKPSYQELRNMLIATGDFGADGNTAGAVFIDGSSSVGKAAIADYASYGPNNEVYLNNNQAVSFALKALSVADGKTMEDGTFASFASLVDEIHLSLKSVGGTAHVQVLNLDTGAVVLDQDITSATDLYYNISALGNANVLIRNTGSGILSITNFKITYQKDATQTIDLMSDGGVVSNPDTLNMALAMFNTVKVPTLDATSASLSYEDEVKYNVYFTADDLTDVVEMGLITFGEKLTDGTLEEALEVIPGYVVNGQEYMVTTNGIPAKKMGDALYFKVYARLSDGTYAYSEVLGYSAAVYASNILKKDTSSAKSKALVVALMNYGAEAQKYFGYKTDELMNSFLTEEQQSLIAGYNADAIADPVAADATKASGFTANGGFADFGVAVAFEGAFAINYYATPNVDAEVTMYYWTQADYTAADVLTVENATGAIVMTGEGELTAAVTGIAAKQLEHTVYVAMVYEADGVTYTTGVKAYSLAAYCKSIAAKDGSAMQSLARATAVYGSYAKAYFS